MLRSMKDLEGYAIQATDGTIGHVKDFYFEDNAWVVRYPHRRDRKLAGEPKGVDLANVDRPSGLERKSATCLDHEGAGEEQP